MSENIITKQCSRCKKVKPISEFRKWRKTCKSCENMLRVQYGNTEKGKEISRKSSKKFRQSEKGKITIRKSCKKYSLTENGKIHSRNRVKRYNTSHPERLKAHNATGCAIRAERLPRPSTLKCLYCPAQAQEYHHPSYEPEHWLDVEPVCEKCHLKLRQKNEPTNPLVCHLCI